MNVSYLILNPIDFIGRFRISFDTSPPTFDADWGQHLEEVHAGVWINWTFGSRNVWSFTDHGGDEQWRWTAPCRLCWVGWFPATPVTKCFGIHIVKHSERKTRMSTCLPRTYGGTMCWCQWCWLFLGVGDRKVNHGQLWEVTKSTGEWVWDGAGPIEGLLAVQDCSGPCDANEHQTTLLGVYSVPKLVTFGWTGILTGLPSGGMPFCGRLFM